MVLLLPNSVFYHVPKTGGTWVRKALYEAGITDKSFIYAINKHSSYKDIPASDRFSFCFVRNPYTYLQSYWAYRMMQEWKENNRSDDDVQSTVFIDFVNNVVEKYPGKITKIYERYVGTEGNIVMDFIGRYEYVVDDLILALTMAGEVFDEEKIRNCKPINAASQLEKWKDQCVYTHDLKEKVWESEKSIFERFGYKKDSIFVVSD